MKGFTLIEVLIATLLMMMMGSILLTSLTTSANAKDEVEKISLRYQMIRKALTRMSREIGLAYMSKHINKSDPVFYTQFHGYNDRLYFSAFGNNQKKRDEVVSDEQVLGFFLGTDKEGKKSLMRKSADNLNTDVEKGGRVQLLLPDVSSIAFSYYNQRLEKWEERWFADPVHKPEDLEEKGQAKNEELQSWKLPAFVKVKITAPLKAGEEITWQTEAELLMQTPLDLN